MNSCCARCRRGTKATGLGPCGYGGKCKCHAIVHTFDGEPRNGLSRYEYMSDQEKPAESHERRTQ